MFVYLYLAHIGGLLPLHPFKPGGKIQCVRVITVISLEERGSHLIGDSSSMGSSYLLNFI